MKRILPCLLVLCSTAYGQLKPKDTYTVNVNYPDYMVKASVLYNNPRLNSKEALTYYWYTSNKIMQTRGGFDGRILDGPYTSYYMSNNLKEKGIFKSGLKNGEWISWFENGQIREISHWKNGLKSGTDKVFGADGKLQTQTDYRNDKIDGYQLSYEGDKISARKKYRKGVEQVAKVKPAKVEKEKPAASSEKKKDHYLFKKKEQKVEKSKPAQEQKKEKQTLKQRWKALFKKKDKKDKKEKSGAAK